MSTEFGSAGFDEWIQKMQSRTGKGDGSGDPSQNDAETPSSIAEEALSDDAPPAVAANIEDEASPDTTSSSPIDSSDYGSNIVMSDDEGENDEAAPVDLDKEAEATRSPSSSSLDPSLFGTVSSKPDDFDDAADLKFPAKPRKVKYDDLAGQKGNSFKVPRLNKTRVLIVLFCLIGGMLLLVNMIFMNERKKQKQEEKEKNVPVRTYDVDLGDYKSRAYKSDQEEDPMADIKPAASQPVFKEPPKYQAPPAQPRTSTAPRKSKSQEAEEKAIRSTLVKNVPGFGREGGVGRPDRVEEMSLQDIPPSGGIQPNFGGFDDYGRPLSSGQEYGAERVASIARALNKTGLTQPIQQEIDKVNNGRFSDAGVFNPTNTGSGKIRLLGDNMIFPGTIIHAVLVSGINTDFPADITARTIENVFDSKTGENLLIPQGSILKGNYSSSSIGIAKVQIAWTDLIVNKDGVAYQVSLGGMAGVDREGHAGIKGTLDDHYWQWVKAAGIMSMFTIINNEIAYQTKPNTTDSFRELLDSNQAIVNKIGDKLTERALDIQTTVKVKNGKLVSVSVNTPVELVPFERFKVEQEYTR